MPPDSGSVHEQRREAMHGLLPMPLTVAARSIRQEAATQIEWVDLATLRITMPVPDSMQAVKSQPPTSLLGRVAAGESAAVAECITRYGALVWSLARRFCGNQADAEDAVQEIFISVWESADRFDESVASETTFIAMIARRRLIDRRRKLLRRKDTAAMPEPMAEPAEDVEADQVELGDEARRASKMLQQLRPEQKQVLELSLVYGRTYEQIALATGLPVGTVKTHARRGLIRVRELIGADSGITGGTDRELEVTS